MIDQPARDKIAEIVGILSQFQARFEPLENHSRPKLEINLDSFVVEETSEETSEETTSEQS